ncbi:MAG: prephenate dehydratase, partial [Phaeodactylibacter sp.]|nr:prephenate dehydratase [Phaeodactylibacter sp.]
RQISDLEEVHSHPMAIEQCRHFFSQYPHIRLVESSDTASSAQAIREKGLERVGAIASTLAAEMHNLEIIAPGIETNKKNYTRFWVVQPKGHAPVSESANKVSLCFAVEHEVGHLHRILSVFAAYNLNLTKIQSAPIPGRTWEYHFFVDFEVRGKISWKQALEAIEPLVMEIKVLGAYQKGLYHDY